MTTTYRKKLSDYTEQEIQTIKETVSKAALYGFGIKQGAELVGLSIRQLQNLIDSDPEFKSTYQANRTEGVKNMSAKMHELGSKGNYQAMAFILSRDEQSPYRDNALKIDPKELDALEQIWAFIAQEGGLLPPPQITCPKCGHQFPKKPFQHSIKIDNPDNNPTLN